MNEENGSGMNHDQIPEVPDAPNMNFGDSDYGDDDKVTRGNKGMFIALLVMLLIGGVIGSFWYLDKVDYEKWDKELQRVAQLPDGEFEAGLRGIMEKSDRKDILGQVAFELGKAGDKKAVPLLTKAVKKGGDVAEEAAMALSMIGGEEAKASVNDIFDQMNKTVELRQAKFAYVLCMLGDDRGFPTLLEAIGKQLVTAKNIPGYDPDLIARVGTTDRLIQLADAPDPMLKMYAAMELGFREDKDPIPPLLKLIKDPNNEVAQAAAISLGRTADPRAGKALLDKIAEAPDMLNAILSAVTQSVGAPGLEVIYNNTETPSIKYKIIGKIKKLRDPRSVDLLLKVTDEEFPGSKDDKIASQDNIRNQALWILEDLGDTRIGDKMFAKTNWEPVSEEAIPDAAIRYRQDDMARKIANGIVEWFGTINSDGASDYLMKIYKANEPYSNTPECAKRVKVDIGPLMDSMGRTGDQQFCSLIEPFLDKDEGFYSQAASMALGRLKCNNLAETFMSKMIMTKEERKDEKFSTLIESRDWQMEDRLQERRNSIIATRYLGDPKVAETLMSIVLDPVDDPELRTESANSLAYVSDDESMIKIVEMVNDDALDEVARAALIQGLWHNPSELAVEAMLKLLEGEGQRGLVRSAAIVVGESGSKAIEERLNKLLDHKDEHRQRAAVLAILLGGNLDRLDRVLQILNGQEARLVIRDWYETHQVFLTQDIFDSKRVFKRLRIADAIAKKTANTSDEILWPWKHLMQRLKNGWDTSPHGLTAIEVRQLLFESVVKDSENRELAAQILAGLNERGFLLALQAQKGPQSDVARGILRMLNVKSQ